jgi:hypothetical protein
MFAAFVEARLLLAGAGACLSAGAAAVLNAKHLSPVAGQEFALRDDGLILGLG